MKSALASVLLTATVLSIQSAPVQAQDPFGRLYRTFERGLRDLEAIEAETNARPQRERQRPKLASNHQQVMAALDLQTKDCFENQPPSRTSKYLEELKQILLTVKHHTHNCIILAKKSHKQATAAYNETGTDFYLQVVRKNEKEITKAFRPARDEYDRLLKLVDQRIEYFKTMPKMVLPELPPPDNY